MVSSTANPLWPHYAAVAAIALALVAGLFRFLVLDAQDPLKCSALLNTGQWLDANQKNWQPEGCMVHKYTPKDVTTCMSKKRVIFAGDSVTRQLFFSYIHLADASLPAQPPEDNTKHSDYSFTAPEGNVNFDFIWDPFLNSTRTKSIISPTYIPEGDNRPAMVVLGSGLWYLRYANDSGGLPAWEATIDSTFSSIQQHMPGLADRVIVLPVETPVIEKLSPERAATIHLGDVDAMNADLQQRLTKLNPATSIFGPTPPPTTPIGVPSIFNAMLRHSQTEDGLHFSDSVLSQHANILLNFQCNEAMPKMFPFDKTCCNSYPQTPFLQLFLLTVTIFFGIFCKYAGPRLAAYKPQIANFMPGSDYFIPLTIFGAVVGLNFLADRTTVWMKEQKQFDPWMFTGLGILSLAAGLGTLKKKDKDLGFLNREQTDEWKGWMQIAILIYHYLGASKISGIYNPIRVLVAAYLWMSGYGHFHFYYKKADYGMLRIAQVMVRLNLLTVVLAYVMDTDYVFYYFAPLVSFWFAVIYGTMVIGHKYNQNTVFVSLKILLSSAVLTYVFKSEWLLDALFDFLHQFFNIRWEAREWIFRVSLDMWIVYIGMFTALATIKFSEHKLGDHPQWPTVKKGAIGVSVLALIWFFWFELVQPSKFAYNKYHPYMSWAPVLSFIVLRNATPLLRSVNSRAFAFIGRCSLETFIMQYHFWLAADTRGILMVLPLGTAYRTLNMAVSTVGFIYVCHHVAEATGWLTNWICGTPRKRALPGPGGNASAVAAPRPQRPAGTEEAVPLLPTNGEAKGEGEEKPTDIEGASGQPPRPNLEIPDGAARPANRWLDRLADGGAASPGPGWSPYLATRNRVFSAWTDASESPGMKLGVKGAAILVALWIFNLLWAT